MMISRENFVELVDHTLLKPEATRSQILNVAREALDLGTASVCVNSYWVPEVAEVVKDSEVKVCAVVGFPLGSTNVEAVTVETSTAIKQGAEEIDMVIPLGLVKSGDFELVAEYIQAVRSAALGATLKVILETAALDDQEITNACIASASAGADFVKTSTGFHSAGGATLHAVQLMKTSVGSRLGIKASGGIRTLNDVQEMVDAGATRLGMSATLSLFQQLPEHS